MLVFQGVFQTHKAIFHCNDGLGHPGQFVYIRDDRQEEEYFGLCEVEVFAFRGRHSCSHPVVSFLVVLFVFCYNTYFNCRWCNYRLYVLITVRIELFIYVRVSYTTEILLKSLPPVMVRC